MNKLLLSLIALWMLGELLLANAQKQQSPSVELPVETVNKLFQNQSVKPVPKAAPPTEEATETVTDALVGEDIGTKGEDSDLLIVQLQMQQHLKLMQQYAQGQTIDGIGQLQFDMIQRMRDMVNQLQPAQAPIVSSVPTQGQAGQQAGIGSVGDSQSQESQTDNPPQGDPVEDRWNRLPPEIRIPLRESAAQPFLPGYEDLLKQFYLKLNRK